VKPGGILALEEIMRPFDIRDIRDDAAAGAVVTREIKQWSNQIDGDLQDAMSDVDWDIRSSSSDVSKFTDIITSFIAR